jgi:ABC-type transport system substrate-binding protein
MDKRKLGGVSVILSVFVVSVLVMGAVPIGALADDEGTRADLILRIGAQDDTKMINFWGYAHSPDVWTSNVLAPVYEGVGQEDPDTEEPIPYLLKGIDADESGTFDLDEYGVYRKETGLNPLTATAYYDFNGAIFHDGVQVTMDDLLFSYHISSLVPTEISLDSLKDKNGLPGTNFTSTHYLHLWPVVDNWDAAIPVGSDSSLTFALHFEQQTSYANFVKYTLNGQGIYPRHIWEGTGKRCLTADAGTCTSWKEPLHDDWGIAYDETTHNGVPAGDPNAYNMDEAKIWDLPNSDVIGSGAMEFDNWVPGVSARLIRYDGYEADALDCEDVGGVCTGNFFLYMHQPTIEGMLFLIYKTAQAAVFALQAGEIDVVSWSVPPEFVGGLLVDPNIGIYNTAEKGFFYLSYNMRESPWGYPANDPSQGDDGLWLRRAMSHVIDKKTIVTTLLQNFGVAGDQPVSPAFTRWYNGSVAKYDFDLETARQILDDHYTESYKGGPGLGWSGPWRNLPTINDKQVQILCPQADYDPIRASACNMIASNARDVGLNFVAELMAFGEITDRLDDRTMDIWVLGWRIGSDPPDYYHAFFYSGNAPEGQNYPGFNNGTFDTLITDARAELDPDKQVSLIKQCSGLLMDAVPYDVLYFRTNIEAYRSDRYDNWTVGSAGSIFGGSFWSRIGIHPPSPDALTVTPPVMDSAVKSGSTVSATATVRDPEGATLAGATVEMTLTGSGALGNLSIPGGVTGEVVTGTTNINGQLVANYIAPTVTTDTTVFVSAQALDYDPYPGSTVQFSKTIVKPPGAQFLSVLVDPSNFLLEEGSTMTVDVTVRDQDGIPVDGAAVNLFTEPADPILNPSSGTTTGGSIGTIVFEAPDLPDGVESSIFVLTVNATLSGYDPAQDTKDITVYTPTAGGGGGGTTTEVPAIDVVATIAVIALVTVSIAVFRGVKRR